MRFPPYLKSQGTIGFVAPSFGCNIEPYRTGFLRALDKFKESGYRTQIGPNCFEGNGIGISNTPEKCGEELMEYYCSSENDALISCGGGELMCEVLDHLDFDRLQQAPPKWYMGYSDNTNFTFLLTTLCDTASIYGPCAAAFGMEQWHPALYDAFGCLTGETVTVKGYPSWERESLKSEENPTPEYNLTEPKVLRSYVGEEIVNEAQFEGRLIGGCLDILVNLKGTEFDKVPEFAGKYRRDGIVWFLEACDLNVMSIRRAIWQLKHAGWFSYVKGFLIGRPLAFGEEMMGLDQYHAVVDLLVEYQVPVIMDVDFGHLPPAMPLVCGSYARIRVEGNDISVMMTENSGVK